MRDAIKFWGFWLTLAGIAAVTGFAGGQDPRALTPEETSAVAIDPSIKAGGYPIHVSGDREVPAYSFAALRCQEGATVIWTINPAPVRRWAYNGFLIVAGVPGQKYTVTCVLTDASRGTSLPTSVTVSFKPAPDAPVPPPPPPFPPNPPDPPTPPPVPPVPPGPEADPDVLAVLPKAPSADERQLARVLAGLYAQVAAEVKKTDYGTVGDFLAAYHRVKDNMVQSDLLMPARTAAAAKVAAVFPTAVDAAITKDVRDKAAELFARLAATFGRIQ
jgi:hypothetical protein